MVKRIKQCQAEFKCDNLNETMCIAINAYAPDGNWLCDCGEFTKDTPWNHRIIRQGERIKDKNETYTLSINDNETKSKYHVYYWTGRYPNEKEHITEFEAYNDADAIKVINESHISLVTYVLFNKNDKQIKAS